MKIYIAAHKFFNLPVRKPYQPLFVGAEKLEASERHPDWEYDDGFAGSISRKNAAYCELTGLYWIWKRSHEDIVGLVHYRRFLGSPAGVRRNRSLLSENEIRDSLATHDCILASREPVAQGKYLISLAEQYRITHSSSDLIQLRMILQRFFPSYLSSFDAVMYGTFFSPYNIMICRKKLFDSYARWLFAVERKAEKWIDPVTDRDSYQRRIFGFFAERLLNVFLRKHQLSVDELPVINLMGQDELTTADHPVPPTRISLEDAATLQAPIQNGIDYSPVFDYRFYINHNHDVAEQFIDAPHLTLSHFLTYGIHEGRMAHPHFSLTSYMNGNPRLRVLYHDDRNAYLLHYINHRDDGRHATGYENLFCKHDRIVPSLLDSPLGSWREFTYRKHLQETESKPVLD